MDRTRINIWWGPPRKFSLLREERRVSWLELFYDLVYVIVISRVTHYLSAHASLDGLLTFFYLFLMTYWGWVNGSQYHDLHGSPGIRTRFMTLWQMLAAAALAVTLQGSHEVIWRKTTYALLFLQGFITYLWWSVGIYDKEHRRLSGPYIFCYATSFVLLIITLFCDGTLQAILYWLIPVFNFIPPFFRLYRGTAAFDEFVLSSSMAERLGLITIILLGENILGVVNGMAGFEHLNLRIWTVFMLGIMIVFMVWWYFFSVISDRIGKKGFWIANGIMLMYIPALAALGAVGATFSVLLENINSPGELHVQRARLIFGCSLSIFLWSVIAISALLQYPPAYLKPKKFMQQIVLLAGTLILLLTILLRHADLLIYFLLIGLCLLIIVVLLVTSWFRIEMQHLSEADPQRPEPS